MIIIFQSKTDEVFSAGQVQQSYNQKELLTDLVPTSNLIEIQKYFKNIFELRGFSDQSIQDKLLLFLEESGELAKSIRKNLPNASVDVNRISNYDTVESEIADVLIVLFSIADKLNIDIYSALIDKEQKNVTRSWIKNQ